MAKLIIGCGYLGLRVARLWRGLGERVFAVTRSAERAAQLAAEGIEPLVVDITAGLGAGVNQGVEAGVKQAQLQLPQEVRTLLFAVGYDRTSGRSIHDVYVAGLQSVIGRLPEAFEKFIYISSTGVYGQVTGDEVDEDSPCHPTREGGKACLAAERLLQGSPLASRAVILRLAGIYGPGRIPRSADLVAGRPIDAPAAGWLNLIHVEDAARIVLLADRAAAPPRTYVVSDGQAVQRSDYYAELARLLGAPPPQFASEQGRVGAAVNPGAHAGSVNPGAHAGAAARAAGDKRVQPRRLMRELKPVLVYPSYREGLAAVVAQTPRGRGG